MKASRYSSRDSRPSAATGSARMPTSISPACSLASIGAVWYSYRRSSRRGSPLRTADGHARQQVRTDGRQQRHPQPPAERIALAARQRHHLIARLQDPARARDDRLARLGQAHVVGRPLDQLHAQAVLQLLQLCGERRLADEAACRGPPEVPQVGHRHKIAQVLELHVHAPNIRHLSNASNQSIGAIARPAPSWPLVVTRSRTHDRRRP